MKMQTGSMCVGKPWKHQNTDGHHQCLAHDGYPRRRTLDAGPSSWNESWSSTSLCTRAGWLGPWAFRHALESAPLTARPSSWLLEVAGSKAIYLVIRIQPERPIIWLSRPVRTPVTFDQAYVQYNRPASRHSRVRVTWEAAGRLRTRTVKSSCGVRSGRWAAGPG